MMKPDLADPTERSCNGPHFAVCPRREKEEEGFPDASWAWHGRPGTFFMAGDPVDLARRSADSSYLVLCRLPSWSHGGRKIMPLHPHISSARRRAFPGCDFRCCHRVQQDVIL